MRNTKKTTILWIVLTFFMWAAFVPKQVAFGESNLRWHWFSALSLKNDWRILGGVADVVFEGGKLRAELYDVEGDHRMSVTGSVTNDKINATVTRHGTDDELRKLSGMMSRSERGRLSILLFEKFAGGLVIGITIE